MANLVYINQETAITWLSSTGDHVIALTSLGAGAGRNGALRDGGVAARAGVFTWEAWVVFATAPVVGERVDIYLRTGDGTNYTNDDGTGDGALSAEDKLRNLKYLGSIVVDEASASPTFFAQGRVYIPERHFGPVFWNDTADALSGTALDHGFSLTPVPDEIQ